MPIGFLFAPWGTRMVGTAGSVGAAAVAGNDFGNALTGGAAALFALVGLVLTMMSMTRRNRRESEAEIQAAEQRGARDASDRLTPLLTQAQRDAEFYRATYFARFGPIAPPIMPVDPPTPGGS